MKRPQYMAFKGQSMDNVRAIRGLAENISMYVEAHAAEHTCEQVFGALFESIVAYGYPAVKERRLAPDHVRSLLCEARDHLTRRAQRSPVTEIDKRLLETLREQREAVPPHRLQALTRFLSSSIDERLTILLRRGLVERHWNENDKQAYWQLAGRGRPQFIERNDYAHIAGGALLPLSSVRTHDILRTRMSAPKRR